MKKRFPQKCEILIRLCDFINVIDITCLCESCVYVVKMKKKKGKKGKKRCNMIANVTTLHKRYNDIKNNS